MPKFEVLFVDGQTVVKDVDTADLAKAQARAERRGLVPPDTPASAPEVKIARVKRLADTPKHRD